VRKDFEREDASSENTELPASYSNGISQVGMGRGRERLEWFETLSNSNLWIPSTNIV